MRAHNGIAKPPYLSHCRGQVVLIITFYGPFMALEYGVGGIRIEGEQHKLAPAPLSTHIIFIIIKLFLSLVTTLGFRGGSLERGGTSTATATPPFEGRCEGDQEVDGPWDTGEATLSCHTILSHSQQVPVSDAPSGSDCSPFDPSALPPPLLPAPLGGGDHSEDCLNWYL